MAQPGYLTATLGVAAFMGLTGLAGVAGCAERDPFIAPGGGGGGGGGGGTGSTGGADAGPVVGDGGGGGEIRGRICRVTDVRAGAACVAADGTGLVVEVVETGAQAAVGADGTFTLPGTGAGATLVTNTDHAVWFGAAVQISSAGAILLPVITRADVEALTAANFITLEPGRGILVVHVSVGGAPAVGAALTALDGVVLPFYDAEDPLILSPTGPTGSTGTAVYFNAADGDQVFDVTFGPSTTRYHSFAAGDSLAWAFAAIPSS